MHRSGAQAVMLANALALLSGGLCAAVGLFKLGFVADLLSTPIRYGYLNGIMLPIIIGQLLTLARAPSQNKRTNNGRVSGAA
jgi:MFS superfamily sulfate permease-like transporter